MRRRKTACQIRNHSRLRSFNVPSAEHPERALLPSAGTRSGASGEDLGFADFLPSFPPSLNVQRRTRRSASLPAETKLARKMCVTRSCSSYFGDGTLTNSILCIFLQPHPKTVQGCGETCPGFD